jgi:hypothetical protein
MSTKTDLVIQYRRNGEVVVGSDAAVAEASAEFAARHVVRLPGFLDPELAEAVRRGIEHEGFLETGPEMKGRPAGPAMGAYQGTRLAEDLRPGEMTQLFEELSTNATLLEAFRRVSGSPPLNGAGRVFRILPTGVDLPWHTDTEGGRILDLAIGLSWEPVQGGLFEMRDPDTEAVFNEVEPLAPGDGLLIRLTDDIEHHFQGVRGDVPLCIYSGKFAPAA